MVLTRSGQGSERGSSNTEPINRSVSNLRTLQATNSHTQQIYTSGTSRSSRSALLESVERESRTSNTNTRSCSNLSSSWKRKRDLEVDAARKRFEVQTRILKERERLELEIIDRELAANIKEIEEEGTIKD